MTEKYTFRAKDFYALLESQNYRCPLTGRELTPETTCAEHIIPLRKGGIHALSNIYLVHETVARLKRHYTDAEIQELANDIINTIGKNRADSELDRQRKSKKSTKAKNA